MSKICTVCETDAHLACLQCGFDASTVETARKKGDTMILGKYSEVKTLHLKFGYFESVEPIETELNKYLVEGWELLTLFTDTKYSTHFKCAITEQYAIVGKPRLRSERRRA